MGPVFICQAIFIDSFGRILREESAQFLFLATNENLLLDRFRRLFLVFTTVNFLADDHSDSGLQKVL